MGVGKPQDIREAAKIGYKWFDTVLVTRNARHGTLYSSDMHDEVLRITNSQYANDLRPIDSNCDCEVCKNHSRAYVHHLLKIGEATGMTLATIHNLRYYQKLIEGLS
jgi:queuine tRNA-ribosyltransferase